jgi:hypothetical protein
MSIKEKLSSGCSFFISLYRHLTAKKLRFLQEVAALVQAGLVAVKRERVF